jgi:hypothetical protein
MNNSEPPKCIFVPSKEVIRSLIELAANLCEENLISTSALKGDSLI